MQQAVNAQEVDGMMLDHYTAAYYQRRDKLPRSFITVKKFDLRREVGVLFSKDREFIAGCLAIHRSNIWRLMQTMTVTFQVLASLITQPGYSVILLNKDLR